MALDPIAAIAASGVDDAVLRYVWDDTRASEDFRSSAADVLERAVTLTLRARIALGIGLYEWIVFRFSAVSSDPLPHQVAEAAWCACASRENMDYVEFERAEWLGPVRGPLWCATTWLLSMVFFSDEANDEWEAGIDYLTRLARHVMTDTAPLQAWLDKVLPRLQAAHPAQPDDPFDDLFNEHEERRRGPPVPRETIDPDRTVTADAAPGLIQRLLDRARADRNPFLAD